MRITTFIFFLCWSPALPRPPIVTANTVGDVPPKSAHENSSPNEGIAAESESVASTDQVCADHSQSEKQDRPEATTGLTPEVDNGEKNYREEAGEITSLGEFMGAFRKLGTSWKSVLAEYVDVVRTAGGKNHSGDVYATGLREALVRIQSMVAQAQESVGEGEENRDLGRAWSFRSVPLDEFGRTIDDIYIAFLRWAAVDGEPDDDCGMKGGVNKRDLTNINVSKAFRRLELYALWMEAVANDIMDPPLTAFSIQEAQKAFYMRLTLDDCRRVAWWLDLGGADLTAIKKLSPKATLRYFVWFSHLLMFEENAQVNGAVLIDNMAKVAFWHYMSMLPLQLGMKIDKFMISVIPMKSKMVIFMNRPLWVDIGYGILSLFLPQRMKSRVEMVRGDMQSAVEQLIGKKCIPTGFNDLVGNIEVDIVAEHYLKKKKETH